MSDGYELEELTRIEAALDALVSPTSEDVFQATRPFDERAIASVAAKRAGSGGGGAQPEPWFVYSTGGNTSVGTGGAYLTWVAGNPSFYPGRGTNPLNLTDPTNPVVIADGNYEFDVEVECDQAHAGKFLNFTMLVDLDGVDDGPGYASVPLDSGFVRVTVPCRRFLAAGTKIGVFAYHDVGVAIPVLLWVQASWELT